MVFKARGAAKSLGKWGLLEGEFNGHPLDSAKVSLSLKGG